MKILWFTWKDKKHPLAGGAEVINEALCERLVRAGHEVTLIVGGFSGGLREEMVDGYRVIRLGNRYTVYLLAYVYYKKNLCGYADVVIDEVNTMPFFCKFYVKEKNFLFVHQLCRQIWFYQFIFPFSLIGYLLEPVYLWLLRDRRVVTVSQSTKDELVHFGFSSEKIDIISEGIDIVPISKCPPSKDKFRSITLLYFGSVRPMKRTLDVVKAFEFVKSEISMVQLIIAGDITSAYGKKVQKYSHSSPYNQEIIFWGRATKEEKIKLFQRATLLCVTSLKEGWGLVVTEANSQGTPAVVYDVDGLRDSVKDTVTGWISPKNTPRALSNKIIEAVKDREAYAKVQKSAYQWSLEITFEKSFQDFYALLENNKNF